MLTHLLLNTSGREGAAGCKEEGNRLPASCCRLVSAGYLWIHQQEQHGDDERPSAAFPPLVPSAPPFPRCAGAQQPVLFLEPLMNTKVRGALLSHRLRGEGGGASHQRGTPPTGGIQNGAARRPPPQSVSRIKGRPLIGQARGQLRLTCVSHAGYAQSGTI